MVRNFLIIKFLLFCAFSRPIKKYENTNSKLNKKQFSGYLRKNSRRFTESENTRGNTLREYPHFQTFTNAPPECEMLTLFVPVKLVPKGPLTINTATKHNDAFKRIWNSVLKRINNQELEITLRLDPSEDIVLEQKVNGVTILSQAFPAAKTGYTASLGAIDPVVTSCVLQISDSEVVAVLENLYGTYNDPPFTSNWFFCIKSVIRLIINPDIVGVTKKFTLKIFFENICGVSDLERLDNDLFVLEGQEWEPAP